MNTKQDAKVDGTLAEKEQRVCDAVESIKESLYYMRSWQHAVNNREFEALMLIPDPGVLEVLLDGNAAHIQSVLDSSGERDAFEEMAKAGTLVMLLCREGRAYVVGKSHDSEIVRYRMAYAKVPEDHPLVGVMVGGVQGWFESPGAEETSPM